MTEEYLNGGGRVLVEIWIYGHPSISKVVVSLDPLKKDLHLGNYVNGIVTEIHRASVEKFDPGH